MNERGSFKNKIIDKYIGIPALLFLSLFKKRKSLPENIQSAAIIITPAIGDTLLLQPLLRSLKKQRIKVTLFAPKSTISTAELTDYYDEIKEISYFSPYSTIKEIRKEKFDIFIDAGQWTRLSSILTYFSKSKYKIGFKTKGQAKHFIFDKQVEHSNKIHEVYNLFNLNVKTDEEIIFPKITLDNIKTEKNKIVLHLKPGGYLSYLKELPGEYAEKVIRYLLSRGYSIYLTGSKDDYIDLSKIAGKFDREKIFNVAGKLNIKETAELIASSFLVVSVNTGIMHLASALQVNLIAIHGPTNSLRWGPLNKNSIIINSTYASAPCLNLGFEYNCKDRTGECMKTIRPEIIINAINKFIDTQK
ncbi:MAG TPA: glycosyltransferase family 9 protein [Ignavibacteriaceae bacterium]|nr:glycosyltransferase family 9 protein [Ignavibacteriaceae bacterium]